MAKNISKNQWFKDIADNVYLNTAVLNNILCILVHNTGNPVPAATAIATLRHPELFETDNNGTVTNYVGTGIRVLQGALSSTSSLAHNNIYFTFLCLKNKQLETDFYSPEQLAEMYPDDPAYQIATDELTDETKPVVDPVEDMGVT